MPTFSISSTHEEWWWCQARSERCSAQTTSCSVSRAPATTGQRATTRRAPSWWTRCWTWCNWLQGFQLTHPLGGSTGSGMGVVDYCNSLLAACTQQQTDKVQRVLNCAARVILGGSKYDHVTPLIRDDLHWLRVPERITFK